MSYCFNSLASGSSFFTARKAVGAVKNVFIFSPGEEEFLLNKIR